MKNKRAVAIRFLILLVIGVFVALALFFIIPNLLGKSKVEASNLLDSSSDYDGDGISNYFDKCKCIKGEDEYDGCPDSDTPVSPYCECHGELVPEWAKTEFSKCPTQP